MDFTFCRNEKIKSRLLQDKLFAEGKSMVVYPLRAVYMPAPPEATCSQVLVSVPKKRFKHAVDRNRLKRLMREAYRLNKHLMAAPQSPSQFWTVAFIYSSPRIHSQLKVTKSLVEIIQKFQ